MFLTATFGPRCVRPKRFLAAIAEPAKRQSIAVNTRNLFILYLIIGGGEYPHPLLTSWIL
jgi:hypothetical protein